MCPSRALLVMNARRAGCARRVHVRKPPQQALRALLVHPAHPWLPQVEHAAPYIQNRGSVKAVLLLWVTGCGSRQDESEKGATVPARQLSGVGTDGEIADSWKCGSPLREEVGDEATHS